MTPTHSDNTPYIFTDYFERGEEHSPFLTAQSRGWGGDLRLKASLLSALCLALAFFCLFFPSLIPLSYFLIVAVYFLAGIPALIESIENLLSFKVTISVLMTLAAFSSVLIGSGIEGGLLLVLFELSAALEERVTHKARGAISRLHRLAPSKATILQKDGTLIQRSVKDIAVGAEILVQAGQLIPLDGKVIQGKSAVNLVHLTGENLPVSKVEGDDVPAGGRNLDGALVLSVTRSNADSTVARIIDLVTKAQEARPKLEQWFTRLSRKYAIAIICISIFLALTLPFILGMPFLGDSGSIYRALSFLIAASPCALIIAIPIAYLSAVGSCARKGILLKGGVTLDALNSCQIIAFDKTGTLTTGELSLIEMHALEEKSKAFLTKALRGAIALERNAIHPIAKAFLSYAKEHSITPLELKTFKSVPGLGLEGSIEEEGVITPLFIGKLSYLQDKIPEASIPLIQKKIEEMAKKGALTTLCLLGTDLFFFSFKDTLRPHIKETLKELHKKKRLKLLMLTGDHQTSAFQVAKELGIDEVYADLKPEDKLHHVSKIAEEKGLAMIGDGVNDAPALARATVGICMGKVGSTAAIDAADVILLHDNLEHLPWLLKKASKTERIVKENLIIAVVAIVSAVTLSLLGVIPLWVAVVLHEGSTVVVGLNGLRLLK